MVYGATASEADFANAEALAAAKDFVRAEAAYRDILTSDPGSYRARIGLARVVLWSGRYAEARRLFTAIGSTEAMEGAATAAYWQGDFRTAAREFRAVSAADPTREMSRKSLADILAAVRPLDAFHTSVVHDDQPLELTRAELRSTFFSDPLTRWDVAAGSYRIHRPDIGETSHAPRVMMRNETVLPWRKVTLAAAIGAIRFPDGASRPLGELTLSARRGPMTWRASAVQRELITSASGRHRTTRAGEIGIDYRNERGLEAAARATTLEYEDDNEGRSADAWVLLPLRRAEQWSVWAGGSAAWRDTENVRFVIDGLSSSRDPATGTFNYRYNGLYDPYWTPRDFREARIFVGGQVSAGRVRFNAQLDGGRARDRAPAFGPASGASPLPSSRFLFEWDRTATPYRFRLGSTAAIGTAFSFELGLEHNRTADYRSNSAYATLVRRR